MDIGLNLDSKLPKMPMLEIHSCIVYATFGTSTYSFSEESTSTYPLSGEESANECMLLITPGILVR